MSFFTNATFSAEQRTIINYAWHNSVTSAGGFGPTDVFCTESVASGTEMFGHPLKEVKHAYRAFAFS